MKKRFSTVFVSLAAAASVCITPVPVLAAEEDRTAALQEDITAILDDAQEKEENQDITLDEQDAAWSDTAAEIGKLAAYVMLYGSSDGEDNEYEYATGNVSTSSDTYQEYMIQYKPEQNALDLRTIMMTQDSSNTDSYGVFISGIRYDTSKNRWSDYIGTSKMTGLIITADASVDVATLTTTSTLTYSYVTEPAAAASVSELTTAMGDLCDTALQSALTYWKAMVNSTEATTFASIGFKAMDPEHVTKGQETSIDDDRKDDTTADDNQKGDTTSEDNKKDDASSDDDRKDDTSSDDTHKEETASDDNKKEDTASDESRQEIPSDDTKKDDTQNTTTISYADVPRTAYYYDALTWAVKEGITTGTSATTFSPNDTCKRAQMVQFLYILNGRPAVSGSMPFDDVKSGAYYYDAVLWAKQTGITDGKTETTFDPNGDCTRGQMAQFLYNMSGRPIVSGSLPFQDVHRTDFYYNAVRWARQAGVTEGTTADTYSPNEPCTRAQMVQFLYNLSNGSSQKNDPAEKDQKDNENKPTPIDPAPDQKDDSKDNTDSQDRVYSIGQTWSVEGQWDLVIDSVEETSQRNSYSKRNPAAVYIVTYTYYNRGYVDNTGIANGLFLSLTNTGTVVDAQGEVGYSYPNSVTTHPRQVPVGAHITCQVCIGVDHAGDFQINFSHYDGNRVKQNAVFKIAVK